MSMSQNTSDLRDAATAEGACDPTATDLRLSLPDCLQEMRAVLDRAEAAYASGDWLQAVECAEEGLTMIRLSTACLKDQPLPPQYEAFFRCFRAQNEYRQALAFYKQGVLQLRDLPGAAGGAELLRQAQALLEPAIAGLRDDLPTQTLVYEYPVAGRLLRAVTRLRQRLHGVEDRERGR